MLLGNEIKARTNWFQSAPADEGGRCMHVQGCDFITAVFQSAPADEGGRCFALGHRQRLADVSIRARR